MIGATGAMGPKLRTRRHDSVWSRLDWNLKYRAGGVPENIIEVGERQFAYGPQMLPGGRRVLFTLARDLKWDDAEIVVHSLDTAARQVLVRGTDARYVQTGHLVYASGGTLLAVGFDSDTVKITGAAVPVGQHVAQSNLGRTGAAHFWRIARRSGMCLLPLWRPSRSGRWCGSIARDASRPSTCHRAGMRTRDCRLTDRVALPVQKRSGTRSDSGPRAGISHR